MLNQSNRGNFQTLFDAVSLTASDGNAPAIIYLETDKAPLTISRVDLRAEVERHVWALSALGIEERDLVIIAHTQNLESIYCFWGALLLGAIPSMFPTLTEKLDPDIYMDSMAKLAEHSEAKAILTTDDFAPQLRERVPCPVYSSSDLAKNPGSRPKQANPKADDIAFLQHSSGTTGLQKGVALSHAAVLNQIASYSEALELSEADVIVSWLPLYHDMGLIAGFVMPLVQGVPLVLMSPFDWVQHPSMLLRAIQEYKGTLCWLPNFAYNHCARRIRKRDSEGLDLSSIRAFINCSEPVHHSSHVAFVERFAENGVRMDQMAVSYAMAENTFAVTQTPVGQVARVDVVDRAALENERTASPADPDAPTAQVNVSCGPPIAEAKVQVINEAGETLPERAVGEIAIRSSFMLSGYYKRDDLNTKLWHDGWYRSGDMGYIADGEVYIAGRKKDLIINSGKNVYPQDLEAIVNTVPGVHPGRAVAFGVYDERDGTELIGIVAEVDTQDAEERTRIGAAIRAEIARQTTVSASYVAVVDEKWLIKTSSGKIARAANRDKWQAEREGRVVTPEA
jgi:fatty-acyl-CoA synthase